MNKVIISAIAACMMFACGGNEMEFWEQSKLLKGYNDSHVLSIDTKGDNILLGTYGRGALFSRDRGELWIPFDTSSGLSWNFILGGAWDGDYIVLATLGDGVNISTDGGVSWARYGYNFFGVEYLYTTGAGIAGGMSYIPTADGLVIFNKIENWKAVTEKEGLASQYLYDMAVHGDTIAIGSLHGFSISFDKGAVWNNFSPNGRFTPSGIPACKVRAVEFSGDTYYAGCDDGLYISRDKGQSWDRLGETELSGSFIHDLIFDDSGRLWIATDKEIARYNGNSLRWRVYNSSHGLPDGGINCLGLIRKDESKAEASKGGYILAGTNTGLYRLVAGAPPKKAAREYDAEFNLTEEPLHQWMLRPISPDNQNDKDQTYLYGSTMGGNFRQHQGNEYNNPEGVPILAVAAGEIVFVDTTIGHSVLKCDRVEYGHEVYAHYHHQHEVLKKIGDRVGRGDIIGTIGKKGNVTNEHLHFEVAFSKIGSQVSAVSQTRNPELWVEPLPGCGTIVGVVTDSTGKLLPGVRVYGATKPIPTETPFSFAESYMDKVHPDDVYKENFVISDLPGGEYILQAEANGQRLKARVKVEPKRVTRISMRLK